MMTAILNVSTGHFLALAAILFAIGVVGALLRRNALIVLMSVELMLNAANLTLLAFAVVGDEKQVVCSPGGPLRAVSGSALLERNPTEDAAERDDGELLRLEPDEEDAPRLLWG